MESGTCMIQIRIILLTVFGKENFSQNCPYEPIILQDILEISKGEQGLVSQKICCKNTKISQCSNVIFLPSNNIILFEKISSSRQSAYYHAEIENILDEIINIQTISEHSWPKMCECNFFPTSDFWLTPKNLMIAFVVVVPAMIWWFHHLWT